MPGPSASRRHVKLGQVGVCSDHSIRRRLLLSVQETFDAAVRENIDEFEMEVK